MGTATAPSSAREALDMVRAGLGYLAAADAAQLGAATQAECLRELEQAGAVLTAARAFVQAGFTAGQGYADDADVQRGVLADPPDAHHPGRRRRAHRVGQADRHPPGGAGGAGRRAGPESAGRLICLWTGQLPEQYREDVRRGAPRGRGAAGLGLEELAALAAQMYERARSELPDEDPGRDFADRGAEAGDSRSAAPG